MTTEDDMEREELDEYRDACQSRLDNILSRPIATGDYSMPSAGEVDAANFLEDEIEATNDLLSLFDDEDDVMKRFLGIK